MVIWITGTSCVGKSTIVKNIIKQFDNFEICKPVGKIRCTKFGDLLVVGGTYMKKVKLPGLDADSRPHSKSAKVNNFKDLISREYSKNKNILCETQSRAFLNKDILYWLIDNFKFKMFYLTTDKTTLDDRAKKRNALYDKLRTDKRTIKDINYVNSIVSDEKISKHIIELTNDNMCDSMENTKIISNFME
tara:strand:- start:35 stop:604 length:570 start_codon:yes stop_codon:yes gene_type:complete